MCLMSILILVSSVCIDLSTKRFRIFTVHTVIVYVLHLNIAQWLGDFITNNNSCFVLANTELQCIEVTKTTKCENHFDAFDQNPFSNYCLC